jgi:hypothetical protein
MLHPGVERRLDLSAPRYFSAGGRGLRRHRHRADTAVAFYDLQRFTMDEVSLVDDPAVNVGAVRFVPIDFLLPQAGGFPNDLGHHARAVLTRAHAAVRVEARTRHRALTVHAVEVTSKADPAPASMLYRTDSAGRPIHVRRNCGVIVAVGRQAVGRQ